MAKYYGPAMAAGALGQAISDTLSGLLAGEEYRGRSLTVFEDAADKQQARLMREARFPFQAQLDQQALEKGGIDIATGRETLANAPLVRRGLEQGLTKGALDIQGAQAKLTSDKQTLDWEAYRQQRMRGLVGALQNAKTADDFARVFSQHADVVGKDAPGFMSEWLRDASRNFKTPNELYMHLLNHPEMLAANPRLGTFMTAWERREALEDQVKQADIRYKGSAAKWMDERDRSGKGSSKDTSLSAKDRKVLDLKRIALTKQLDELKHFENEITKGGKPVGPDGKPWTNATIAKQRKRVYDELTEVINKLTQNEQEGTTDMVGVLLKALQEAP